MKFPRTLSYFCPIHVRDVFPLCVLLIFSISVIFLQANEISEDTIRLLSYTCQGCFSPLCATVGGFVAQEALKAITGKFTPLNQWVSYHDNMSVQCIPHHNPFFIVKLGCTEVYLFCLVFIENIDCGYSLEPPHDNCNKKYL